MAVGSLEFAWRREREKITACGQLVREVKKRGKK
jgi:hypothetical protein